MYAYACLHEKQKKTFDDALGTATKQLRTAIRPPLLYHYTDFNGFRGILSSNTLRATWSPVLNDGAERKYGEEAISAALRKLLPTDLHLQVEEFFKTSVRGQGAPFLTCFCQDCSLLSMWRGYAGNGGGFCLGFDPEALLRQFPRTILSQVSYGWPFTPNVLAFLQTASAPILQDTNFLSLCLDLCCVGANAIKHPAFAEEREWRMINLFPTFADMQFSMGHANVRPYVDFSPATLDGKAPILPIKKVIYGPTLREEDQPTQIIKWMLLKYGYQDVEVESCGIPYRL